MHLTSFVLTPSGSLRRAAAFTLIELLTVMAIIVLLAALILGIANHANTKGAMSRATTEIRAFETGVESYKLDNGTVPRDASSPSVTDSLNPQMDFDPATGDGKYKNASHYLYMALSGFMPGVNGAVGTYNPSKQYLTFQPNQLEIFTAGGNDKVKNPGSPNMYIVDPFGFSYGYSTAYQYQVDQANNATPGSTPTPGYGYNPTCDIWSTSGYSRSGKGTPTNGANASPAAIYSNLWLKNW